MNTDRIVPKQKWLKLKTELIKTWTKITDDDLEKTKGDLKAISAVIQQKYDEPKDVSNTKMAEILKRIETKK